MTARKLIFLYLPELCWPLVVFFGSVVLPLALFLVTLKESPLSILDTFTIANQRNKILDALLMVVPLAFLYQFVGMRLVPAIMRSKIEYAEGFVFWFVVLPCVCLLGFIILIAFYFAGMRDVSFEQKDLALALLSAWAAFCFLIWFEIGVSVGRIIDQSPQPPART